MNFLRPNHNVWRIERAARAAILIDAAAFFEAVRGACLKAKRSIFVVAEDGTLRYVEYVPEIAQHPDYDAALDAAKKLIA